MTLYSDLKMAKTEEEVKDAYVKWLGLKGVRKNLIDMQIDEVWFEAKYKPTSTYAMFTQLLFYIAQARKNPSEDNRIPPLLCVFDSAKAAIMRTEDVLPLLDRNSIKWGKSASQISPEALIEVSNYIGVHLVSFVIETHENEFIYTMKEAIRTGTISRIPITPNNLKQVFDRWVCMIGRELKGVAESDYGLLFFADIMHDGNQSVCQLPAEVLFSGSEPVFFYETQRFRLSNKEGYRRFWAIYDRPPKKEHRTYLLERRDSLISHEERVFKGAYYTPIKLVSKAYEYLDLTLGGDWQKDYIIWDMCCGVGNLEAIHGYPRNIFMSTLDLEDIKIMETSKTCVGAQRFQYDYLNDDITNEGTIDYSLSNKIPKSLRDAIIEAKNGSKKILCLINPPYAEAGSGIAIKESKDGVSDTLWSRVGMNGFGKAKNELFAQFLTRIQKELPNCTLAVFSTPKYINSESFSFFQSQWLGEALGGLVVHSKAFDGIKGSFPISFVIWKMGNGKSLQQPDPIELDAYDKNIELCGKKMFFPLNDSTLLNRWIERPKADKKFECIPLKNAVSPSITYSTNLWNSLAIGYMCCHGNDVRLGQQKTILLSSTFGDGHGFYVTKDNILKSAITFSVRMSTPLTWLTHQDQFYAPNKQISHDLENDCLIYMLFSGKNLTASANNLQWDNRDWAIVNHFIPFSEKEVGATDRFESSFMKDFLGTRGVLSHEALNVMNEGKKLWQIFFEDNVDDLSTRSRLYLNRPDVGWYQIRKTLEVRITQGFNNLPTSFTDFDKAFKTLEQKISSQFFDLGFIR
jgi:hypothetical protein